jgi:CheY-like chemotaxis protein
MIHAVLPQNKRDQVVTGYSEVDARSALEAIEKWQSLKQPSWHLVDMEVAC